MIEIKPKMIKKVDEAEGKVSHLSTLIARIKRQEDHGGDKIDDPLFQGRLMNLAEYMTYYDNWSKEEGEEAKELLSKYNFDVQLSAQGIERKYIELRGLPNNYSETCCRCGRRLSNPYSVKKGLGPICRSKVRRGDWGKEQNEVMKKLEGGKPSLLG